MHAGWIGEREVAYAGDVGGDVARPERHVNARRIAVAVDERELTFHLYQHL